MTAKELIAELSSYPPNTNVLFWPRQADLFAIDGAGFTSPDGLILTGGRWDTVNFNELKHIANEKEVTT